MQDLPGKTDGWNASEATASEGAVSETPPSGAMSGALDTDMAALAADAEAAAGFVTDALDQLGTIESILHQLESAPEDVRLLNEVFRSFHRVRSSAGVRRVATVEGLAHKVEGLLDRARTGKHRMGPQEFGLVLKAVDLLTAYMFEISARVAGNQGEDPEPRRLDLIRAVEAILNASGAARATTHPLEIASATTPTAIPAETELPQTARRDEQASVTVDPRTLDNVVAMAGEMVVLQAIIEQDQALVRVIDERVARNLGQLRRITIDLQRHAMSMPMAPVRTSQTVARLVSAINRASGKPFELVRPDEQSALEHRVVEGLNDR